MNEAEEKLNDEQHAALRNDLSRACKDLDDIEGTVTRRIDEMYSNWGKFYESQEVRDKDREERFLNEVKELRGAVDRKAELDATLLGKVREVSTRIEYLAVKKEKSDKTEQYLVMYFRDIRDLLRGVDLRKMRDDVGALEKWMTAHNQHHEKVLEPKILMLQIHGGKVAQRVIWAFASAGIGGLAIWILEKILGH